MSKLYTLIFLCAALLLSAVFGFMPLGAMAAPQLVKSKEFSTVYYIDESGIRHAFPNGVTYQSWYGDDTSKIVTVDNAFLQNYPLGANVTMRPGTYLVKIRTAPQVYAVERGGVLRELQSEAIAQNIYGQDWSKRIVDIPDVFFGDYQIGSPIIHDYTVPDSILYYHAPTKSYYHKENTVLLPFASEQAVTENYYDLSQAIVSDRNFFTRDQKISGFDPRVFNPVASPVDSTLDCENKKLKVAVILAVDDDYQISELQKIEQIKNQLPQRFAWATEELSELDISYTTVVIKGDDAILKKMPNGTIDVKNELINVFYDANPDVFDFVVVWTNFKVPSEDTNENARFIPVSNVISGNSTLRLDRSAIYGSTGKLKGIVMMGNINKYNIETTAGMNSALNLLLHEIGHQWSAGVFFAAENGENSAALLREDKEHWSNYLSFISPLGGSGWVDNGDGTFTTPLATMEDTNLRKYSQLDLYLMGLVDKRYVKPVWYVEPESKILMGNIIYGKKVFVNIEQIIKANGNITCNID